MTGILWLIVFILGIFVYQARADAHELRSILKSALFRLSRAEDTIDDLKRIIKNGQSPAPAEPKEKAPAAAKSVSPDPVKTQKVEKPVITDPVKPTPPPVAAKKPTAKPTKPQVSEPQSTAFGDMEKDLSSKWMMWVGGIAFAIGGAFMMKYSIEAGLLSPGIRVTFGAIFGIALAIGGEVLRRNRYRFVGEENDSLKGGYPDYLPSTLSAGGYFLAFASIYAAFALYDFLSPLVAFVALAALSIGAVALALTQGRLFAYLGMIGALVLPVLVSTGSGNAWALFPYLLFVALPTLGIARQRGWSDVAITTIILGLLWVPIWMELKWQADHIFPVGVYLVLLLLMQNYLLRGASQERATNPSASGLIPDHQISLTSDLINIAGMILLVALVRLDHYSLFSMILFNGSIIVSAYYVRKSAEFDMTGLVGVAGILFLLATWHLPYFISTSLDPTLSNGDHNPWGPIASPTVTNFLLSCLAYGAGLLALVFFGLPKLLRQGMWSLIGTVVPLLILLLAYARTDDFNVNLSFAAIAVILSLIFIYCLSQVMRDGRIKTDTPIAAYSAAATAAVALAIFMTVRDSWLTFALALQVAAMGYIWRKTQIQGLRIWALVIAITVLVRLLFNMEIFKYADGPLQTVNWLWYGYGLTAILFYIAYNLFLKSDDNKAEPVDDNLSATLLAGWILLGFSFITLEIRVLFSETGILTGDFGTLEKAVLTLNWSASTLVLMWHEMNTGNTVIKAIRRFMTLVTLAGLVIGNGLTSNIYFQPVKIGTWSILNLQLLQFFIPGLLYGAKAWLSLKRDRKTSAKIYGAVAFATIWFWMSAEVRHLFFPEGQSGTPSDWEGYLYSVVWLFYAVIILGVGLVKNLEIVRKGGLILLGFVVCKVFLWDMSNLEGLARALSFMGLGAGLVGIGYLYQRLNIAEKSTNEATT